MRAFIIFLLVTAAWGSLADESKGVQVTGECEKEVEPDRVFVMFALEELADSVQKSTEKANERYNQLVSAVKKMKLKDARLSTSEYSTSPVREYENNKYVFKGYRTRIGLKVATSEMDRAGKILQAGGELGQESIHGPNPFVSVQKSKKVYEECLKEASANATSKAMLLAKSLNVKLGKAFRVEEEGQRDYGPAPMPYKVMAKSVQGAHEAPQIEYGKEVIKVKLMVSFGIK